MPIHSVSEIFTRERLDMLFPKDRADSFFDALFGDAGEGSYDISLEFKKQSEDRLEFEFHLKQRPGKCLVCNLTYGLPAVFSRHPVINVKGLVQEIVCLLDGASGSKWQLGNTREISKKLHIIPLTVFADKHP